MNEKQTIQSFQKALLENIPPIMTFKFNESIVEETKSYKNALGQTISIGDWVVYPSGYRLPTLKIGRVFKIWKIANTISSSDDFIDKVIIETGYENNGTYRTHHKNIYISQRLFKIDDILTIDIEKNINVKILLILDLMKVKYNKTRNIG